MADELPISYDKRELLSIITAFKAMDDEAIDAAKRESFALAQYAANEVKAYGITRTFGQAVVNRITSGVKVSKTSKIGEFSHGFASQRFSGGGSTKDLWAGYEFGSNRYGVSSHDAPHVKAEEILAISSIQPFAKFSLN